MRLNYDSTDIGQRKKGADAGYEVTCKLNKEYCKKTRREHDKDRGSRISS